MTYITILLYVVPLILLTIIAYTIKDKDLAITALVPLLNLVVALFFIGAIPIAINKYNKSKHKKQPFYNILYLRKK